MTQLSRVAGNPLGIAVGLAPASRAAGQPSGSIEVTLYAYDYDAKGQMIDRAGVTCLLVRFNGTEVFGTTNAEGGATLAHTDVFRQENLAFLFCGSDSDPVCSVVRIDVPYLRRSAEYNIQMTTLAIIDGLPVRRASGGGKLCKYALQRAGAPGASAETDMCGRAGS